MPREGITYDVDADWRTRVLARLDELEMTKADLAREVGCSRSLVTELLKGTRKQTTFLPEIHDALSWPPPQPPLPSKDAGELQYIWDRLDEAGKEAMIARGRVELDRLLRRAKLDESKKSR
jgi:predicted transcriptional regulator